MADKYDALKLENQICFPLYAAAREIVKLYTPFLKEVDLTYTQYVAMMVLWDRKEISVKKMGELLYLDSGTLTPLLKTLEKKGFISRKRSEMDERIVLASVTEKGMALREKAVLIPEKIGGCVPLEMEEAGQLYRILYKLLGKDFNEGNWYSI